MAAEKRFIPTVQEFYKTKKAMKTYTYLLIHSTFDPEKSKERFFDLGLANIVRMVNKIGIGRRTFYRHLDELTEKGFLRKEENTIYFSQEFNYTFINPETLKFLMNSTNHYTIAVFAELSWRWRTYGKQGKVLFSQHLLLNQIGLSNQGTNHAIIRDILALLHNNGLIEWETICTPNGNVLMNLKNLETYVKKIEVKHNTEKIVSAEEVNTQGGYKALGISANDF